VSAREGEADDVGGLCAADPLAKHLANLKPVPAPVDRDRLMFAAGAAAHDRAGAWWKRAFFAQSGIAAAVVLAVVAGGVEPPNTRGNRERNHYATDVQPAPAGPPPAASPKLQAPSAPRSPESFAAESSDANKWLQLRADVFAAGVGVLPTPAAPPQVPDVTTVTATEKSLQLDPRVLAVPHRPKPVAEPEMP
jgi:hypothetical protein